MPAADTVAVTAVAQHAPSRPSTSQGADSTAIMDLATSAPSTLGNAAPPTASLHSGRISTRTRRRTAAATGTAPPAVDYGFGPCGVPRPSARRVHTPPRVTRPRRSLTVVTFPARAASPVSTYPFRPTATAPSLWELLFKDLRSCLVSRPPQLQTWMPSALLPNYSSRIPRRVIRTPAGRGSNRPSP